MGGAAAIAGALGPTIGGALTSAFSWRLVLLVNVPLAVVCLVVTLSAAPKRSPSRGGRPGGFPWGRAVVPGNRGSSVRADRNPVGGAGVASRARSGGRGCAWWNRVCLLGAADRESADGREPPASDPNYLGATISQAVGGFVEMGLGYIFPLLLILDLGMSPFLAGLALIPTTVPMVILSTSVGRWYDRSGGRPPLVVGFVLLGLSGLVLGLGVHLLQPRLQLLLSSAWSAGVRVRTRFRAHRL